MTYAQKLKDPRWAEFRSNYLRRHSPACVHCGGWERLEIHHRRYIPGREPWDYDDEDLMLLCYKHHQLITGAEAECRDFVRSIEPHQCYEFRSLVRELKEIEPKHLKVILARLVNEAMDLRYALPSHG